MSIRATEVQHGQPMLETMGGMVTANHRRAAEAGAGMLARGGNAVDAAVSTAIAVGVVEPAMSGIAGRGYMLIHFAGDGTNAVIDGHERAPLASRADMYDVQASEQIPTHGWGPQYRVAEDAHMLGHRAVAVPGVLAALCLAHERYGTLPLATVMEPAIGLAEEGFAVSVPLSVMIQQNREKLARFPATSAVFLKDGHALRPGDWLRQPDLARSFRLVAEHEAAALYEGPLADAIVAEMERGGGIVTKRDLAEFEPRVWDEPLVGTYRGYRLLTMPEATGGITLLQIMNMLEGYDLAAYEPFDARYLHLQLEATRIAFRDRMEYVDDPAFAAVPFAGLASKAFAEQRRALILSDRVLDEIRPGDPWAFDGGGAGQPSARPVSWRGGDSHTTHFCAIDRERTMVSMTQSIIDAFGSGVVVPGTGMLLNSAMHNFNPLPGQLGSIAPWKRSAHNGVPVIVLREDGRPMLAIGGAGGTKIITGVAQMLVNLIDRGWSMQDVVAAPRVHNEGWDSQVDARIVAETQAELRRMGHELEIVASGYGTPGFSRINGIGIDDKNRLTSGVDINSEAGAAVCD